MRPTIWLGVAALVAGLLSTVAGVEWGGLAAGLAGLGALLDALYLPRHRGLRVERELPERIRQAREMTVGLRIQSLLGRPLTVLLRDEPPPGARAPKPMRCVLQPRGEARVSYSLTIEERGLQPFGRVFWLAFGPLHLMARQVAVALAQQVLVYPDLLSGRPRLSTGRAGRGERPAQPGQFGQFESLRDYAPGDPYRSINWLASARRGSILVNTYRAESEQPVLLLVDSGRTLFGAGPGGDRMATALRAAYALADEAMGYGDRVGLLVYDSERRHEIAPTSGVEGLHRVARAFALTEARPVEPDHLGALGWAIEVRARRSLVVWFTDLGEAALQEELLPFLRGLSRQRLVLQVAIPKGERAAAASEDPFRVAADVLVRREARVRAAQLSGAGVMLVRGTAAQALDAAVRRAYREIKERGRL